MTSNSLAILSCNARRTEGDRKGKFDHSALLDSFGSHRFWNSTAFSLRQSRDPTQSTFTHARLVLAIYWNGFAAGMEKLYWGTREVVSSLFVTANTRMTTTTTTTLSFTSRTSITLANTRFQLRRVPGPPVSCSREASSSTPSPELQSWLIRSCFVDSSRQTRGSPFYKLIPRDSGAEDGGVWLESPLENFFLKLSMTTTSHIKGQPSFVSERFECPKVVMNFRPQSSRVGSRTRALIKSFRQSLTLRRCGTYGVCKCLDGRFLTATEILTAKRSLSSENEGESPIWKLHLCHDPPNEALFQMTLAFMTMRPPEHLRPLTC